MARFFKEEIATGIRRIWAMPAVCMYLVEGSEKALLIDTGCGETGLKEYVEQLLQGKPYDALLTHGHVDHASGAGAFEKVWLHPADHELAQEQCTIENRMAYWKHCRAILNKMPLPEKDDFVSSRMSDFLPLTDGQVFDLGGRTVKLLHVPGHTRGMMVPFVPQVGAAFLGDACGTGTLLVGEESTTVQVYYESLLWLQKDAPPFERVYRQHGSFESSPAILQENIEVCERILAGTDDAVLQEFMGKPCRRAMRVEEKTRKRLDGKEGNILYCADKIR